MSYHSGHREHRGFRGTAENAKTVLCTRFTSPDGCRFGDRCNFAHGDMELQARKPRHHGASAHNIPPSATAPVHTYAAQKFGETLRTLARLSCRLAPLPHRLCTPASNVWCH